MKNLLLIVLVFPLCLSAQIIAPTSKKDTVVVKNFPPTQAVTGPVTDQQLRASPLPVTGTFSSSFDSLQSRKVIQISNFPATQTVSGSVSVTNPYSVIASDSIKYRKSISVDNFPSTQSVTGTLSVSNPYTVNAADSVKYRKVVSIDNFPSTQPVSGTVTVSNPYAVSASDSSKYRKTISVDNFPSAQAVTGTFWQATQPVSVSSLPLPSGASTASLQTTANSSLSSIDTKFPSGLTVSSTRLLTDGSGVTQPVSGSLTVLNPYSVDAADSNKYRKVVSVDNFPATQTVSGSVSVSNFPSSQAVTGTFWQATQPVSGTVTANAGTNLNTSLLALESGGNLAAVNTKTPSLGTASASASTPTTESFETASGNITTRNLVPAGAATANSAIEISVVGNSTVSIQVTGTYTGALSVQYTIDGTTWVTSSTNTPILNVGAQAFQATITSAQVGVYNVLTYNANKVRVTALAAVTGTAVITMRASKSSGPSFISTPLPVGTNSIGNIGTVSTVTTVSTLSQFAASAASADATALPTSTVTRSVNMVSNGTTLDIARGMGGNSTTGDAGAKTATGNGATITNVGNKGVQIFFVIGAVTGTTPTCTFKVQGSVDAGTNWFDIPNATTASLTASANVGIMVYPGLPTTAGTTTTGTTAQCNAVMPRTWRVVWTIGGTTPSFTITSVNFNYIPN